MSDKIIKYHLKMKTIKKINKKLRQRKVLFIIAILQTIVIIVLSGLLIWRF